MLARRGLMLVLSSPSGAGKTTLSRLLLEADKEIEMSVSVTSRKPRPGEVEGVDYIFVDADTFTRMRDRGEFLEWALVFDNFYGTPKAPVERILATGRDVLFDVDWQGTESLQKAAKTDLVTIFILPPSAGELAHRLKQRAQDPLETVRRRMAGASNEIQHWDDYDYVIINRDVEESLRSVRAILEAERLRRERQPGLAEFVRNLQSEL